MKGGSMWPFAASLNPGIWGLRSSTRERERTQARPEAQLRGESSSPVQDRLRRYSSAGLGSREAYPGSSCLWKKRNILQSTGTYVNGI